MNDLIFKIYIVNERELIQDSSSPPPPTRAVTTKKTPTSPLTGENLQFIEQLYGEYVRDPSSVDPSWVPLFEEYFERRDEPNLNGHAPRFRARGLFEPATARGSGSGSEESPTYEDRLEGTRVSAPGRTSRFAAEVESLVRAYRLHGHLISHIDPLRGTPSQPPPELDPASYGFGPEDMQTPVRCEALFGEEAVPLNEILERLKELYCGSIAIEYQYISDSNQRQWLRREIESNFYAPIEGEEDQQRILKGLVDADSFETFLHKKYIGAKRFSLTGGDSLIPMTRALLDEGGKLGLHEALIGMAHRGRLNVLHNIMGKPAVNMFSEFEKSKNPEKYVGSSDVKYHMGYSSEYVTPEGAEVHLSMAFNPSHLEFVDPVVIGRARAKQARLNEEHATRKIMPLLFHGDAAFPGQGIVAETFNLSLLEGYHVGGTYHIVINNQIGFTTLPSESRSSRYSTDIAKIVEAPILHVNGDDPEACVRAARLAIRYRQHFGRDIVIDLLCYRQYGHNEGDEPRYTQPLMYKIIDGTSHVRQSYAERLVEQGVMTEEQVTLMWEERMESYAPAYAEVKEEPRSKIVSSLEGLWSRFRGGKVERPEALKTRVSEEKLRELGERISHIPEGFDAHRTIKRLFKTRAQMASGEQPLDWGMGEALAMASLLDEGTHIRLSGQDAIRGTFSHRHAALFAGDTGQTYWPARHLHAEQGKLEIINSSLSEAAVLGFEYGYSLDYPDALVGWEAQFGDFVNGAQVIIDQFVNSSEDKWKRLSGLVMLLPHGYEGQGPEHSSARLERFLQLCAEDNMFVCNFTTPAQYFHALRRQVLQEVRKPLIVMTPKSLLRLREATSELEELSQGELHPILDDPTSPKAEGVKRVLLCSGKIYYDLAAYAKEQEREDVAIVRLEQLYPLHASRLSEIVNAYSNAEHLIWVQEEPKNMGPWPFMFPHLIDLFGASPLPRYAGRAESASPATGDPEAHLLEQRKLIREAFDA